MFRNSHRRVWALFLIALLMTLPLTLGVSDPARAQSAKPPGNAAGDLNSVQREIQRKRQESDRLKGQASALKTDLRNLRQRLVSAAKIVQDREFQVITLEAKIADLVRQEKEKVAVLNSNRSQLAGVLVALQKMVQFPPEALLALPESPDNLVRSAILLRAVVPEIDRRAAAVRFDLQALADTRDMTAKQRLNLTSASQDLDRQRKEIRSIMADKSRMLSRTLADERRAAEKVARLAAKARDLKGLMARLADQQRIAEISAAKRRAKAQQDSRNTSAPLKESQEHVERPQTERQVAIVSPPVSIKSRRGRLPLPVVGDLIGRYGQNLSSGLSRKGIDIAARQGSQVIATFDGIIAFAGKFRGYGQLLIIDHGDGYHTLLAGMTHIDAEVGQQVSTGEPVGQMGRGPDNGGEGNKGERPILYVELRRKGQPINPLPWLAARKNKVSG